MLLDLNDPHINRLAQTAEFGIERESLRVTYDGRLAQTKHPFAGKPYLTRDFCENQVEMISDVFTDPDEMNRQLGNLLDEINEVTVLPDFDFDEEKQIKAIDDVKSAAVLDYSEIKRRAKEMLEEIGNFTARYFPEYRYVVNYQINKLSNGNSYAEIVSRRFSEDYMTKGLALAKAYQRGERDV